MIIVSERQICRQCGRCCERWGWGQEGMVEDLRPWLEQNRTDILQHVAIRLSDGKRISGNDLAQEDLSRIVRISYWQDATGNMVRKCPFFRRDENKTAWCTIHDVKPRVCREFTPWTWRNTEFYGRCPACREKAP
ncbi:MAG TPA: YkgJ family cysteine cluster protein [Methanoregulaceae archaeon]|mgnify:FL=1|nr:MAG: YkgJ family cysteine cluster protein [Methanolinea sp.]HON82209.1 YkgJ family cysteine cluster protein [Methanoregulaceae archaeon]HRT14993.1 YkgJ family cysteine cluster protein [Methanoregulaceae archaeon]HRU30565.1 YkgJ family cysteine cluster protein [Methanoregulaceae archaeon]